MAPDATQQDTATPRNPRRLVLEMLEPALARASLSAEALDDDFNLIERGVVDSIEFLDLVARLEERADVQLDLFDADPDVLTTVGGLVDTLADAIGSA